LLPERAQGRPSVSFGRGIWSTRHFEFYRDERPRCSARAAGGEGAYLRGWEQKRAVRHRQGGRRRRGPHAGLPAARGAGLPAARGAGLPAARGAGLASSSPHPRARRRPGPPAAAIAVPGLRSAPPCDNRRSGRRRFAGLRTRGSDGGFSSRGSALRAAAGSRLCGREIADSVCEAIFFSVRNM